MNLQPSELMKIGLILFLAKYYHRISIENVNKIKIFISSNFCFNFPVLLVVMQPDLGTSLLIAAGGLVVAWLAGVRVKFFIYALINFYFIITYCYFFFKTLSKSKNINIFKSLKKIL